MRKLLNFIVLLPVGIILIALSVANRHSVRFSFDPLNPESPFLSFSMPFFVYLFLALLVGMLIGGMATWWTQGRHRKELKSVRAENYRLDREMNVLKDQTKQEPAEYAPGLPSVSKDRAA